MDIYTNVAIWIAHKIWQTYCFEMSKLMTPHHTEGHVHVEWVQSTKAGYEYHYNYCVAIVKMISSDDEIWLVSIYYHIYKFVCKEYRRQKIML